MKFIAIAILLTKICECIPPIKTNQTDMFTVKPDIGEKTLEVGYNLVLNHRTYVVDRLLGKGGLSYAYLAHSSEHGYVVIKTMKPSYDVKWANEYLEKEACILTKLNHPSIIKLIDHGYIDKKYILVLEYFKGTTFSQYLYLNHNNLGNFDEQKEFSKKLRFIKQLLEAFDYLKSKLLHNKDNGDKNILINNDKIMLIDFGGMKNTNGQPLDENRQNMIMWRLTSIILELVYKKDVYEYLRRDDEKISYKFIIDKLGCSDKVARLLRDRIFYPENKMIEPMEFYQELDKLFGEKTFKA